jgi:hypothetical protein
MLDPHGFARQAGALLFEKAERRLDTLPREYGVSDPVDLPPHLAAEFMRRALVSWSTLRIRRCSRFTIPSAA